MAIPQRQYIPFIIIALILTGSTVLQMSSSAVYFQKYFGNINPIVAVTIAGAAGWLLLAVLKRVASYQIIRRRKTLTGIAVSAGLATLLGVAIVIADCLHPYPQDTNVPVPNAFFFYPVMAFVVEVVFHLLPLTIILLLLYPYRHRFRQKIVAWTAILITAISEPTFQVFFAGEPITWAVAYTWIHIFIISVFQLSIFYRYDFVSMYAFRIIYYAYWHIIWGMIRLDILF